MHNDRNSLFTHTCMLSHSVVSDFLQPHGLQPTRSLCPWDFPGKNTRVGCHFLLQGIFPTQGLNPYLFTSPALAGRFFTAEPPGKRARAHTHTHTHTHIKPFRNLITLLYINYFIMVDCKGKWFYVKAKFFPKKLNIILTVYVFIFYICVYFLIFLRKAFTGQHWC